MKFISTLNTMLALSRKEDEKLFLAVHDELAKSKVNQGLWVKALSKSNGDENQAKAKYIKLRVQSMKDDMNIKRASEEVISSVQQEMDNQEMGKIEHTTLSDFERETEEWTRDYDRKQQAFRDTSEAARKKRSDKIKEIMTKINDV